MVIDNFRERQSLRLWLQAAKHARTIFDVGANSGVYALAGAVNKNASIDAFEPIPSGSNLALGARA